jgi:hypothetical protein
MKPQTAGPRAALEFLALDPGMNRMDGFIDCILTHNGLDLSGITQLYINTRSRATMFDNVHVNRLLRVCAMSLRNLKLSVSANLKCASLLFLFSFFFLLNFGLVCSKQNP